MRKNISTPAVLFRPKTADRKLAPVRKIKRTKAGVLKPRPSFEPKGPFVSSTYLPLTTCPDTCQHKHKTCDPEFGFAKMTVDRLNNQAAEMSAFGVIWQECLAIEQAFGGGPVPQDGGRDGRTGRACRLHVSGDVGGSERGVRLLALTGARWLARGGGPMFTYTRWWREIPRDAWSTIRVIASVEHPSEIPLANSLGYAAAVVVKRFEFGDRAFAFQGAAQVQLPKGSTARAVACPAETKKKGNISVTCNSCRLCLGPDLLKTGITIVFEHHGPTMSEFETPSPAPGMKAQSGAVAAPSPDDGKLHLKVAR